MNFISIKKHEMEFLIFWHLSTQPHSHIAIQPHSYIATQPQSHIATQLHSHKGNHKGGAAEGRPPFVEAARGRLLCGYVAMWLCGSVAMELCSYVAIWLCGYVAIKISNLQILNFRNSKNPKVRYTGLPKISKILRSQISQIHIFQGCSHIFLVFFEVI